MLGAARRPLPGKVGMHAFPEELQLAWIARHRVKARLDALHPMHEEAEVDRRLPGNRVPRHGTAREVQLDARHDAPKHAIETLGGDRGPPVAGEEAAPLVDDLAGRAHGLRDASATRSIASQGTGSSGLRRFAFPYQRCCRSSATACSSRLVALLSACPGQTTITSSALSCSAPS